MVEAILFTIMGLSVIGMVTTGFNDPLSRKFWNDMRRL